MLRAVLTHRHAAPARLPSTARLRASLVTLNSPFPSDNPFSHSPRPGSAPPPPFNPAELDDESSAMEFVPPEMAREQKDSRLLFVRPWDGLPTMAHVFAVVRGIESKYGTVEEFFIPREPENNGYLPYFWVTLAGNAVLSTAGSSAHLAVPVPPADPRRDGGLGLDDLAGLLKVEPPSSSGDDATKDSTNMNVWHMADRDTSPSDRQRGWIDVKVEWGLGTSDMRRMNDARRTRALNRVTAFALARGFEGFAGFASEPTKAMLGLQGHYRRIAESKGFRPSWEFNQGWNRDAEGQAQPLEHTTWAAAALREVDPQLSAPAPEALPSAPITPDTPSRPTPEPPTASKSGRSPAMHLVAPTMSLTPLRKADEPPPLSRREKALLAARMAKLVEAAKSGETMTVKGREGKSAAAETAAPKKVGEKQPVGESITSKGPSSELAAAKSMPVLPTALEPEPEPVVENEEQQPEEPEQPGEEPLVKTAEETSNESLVNRLMSWVGRSKPSSSDKDANP